MNRHAPIKALVDMLLASKRKPLPYHVSEGEWEDATPAQQLEWCARMAAGTEPEPLVITELQPELDLLCTMAEYEAATLEQQRSYDRRLIESWQDNRTSDLSDDASWDRRLGFIGE